MNDDRSSGSDSSKRSAQVATAKRGAECVYEALLDAGIELLVGLPGTQTLPLDRTVAAREGMTYVMARHETAIPHIAWGHYETSGEVAATLTVPGPGETNAMHGLKNAAEDGVPIVHIAADVDPDDRGRSPIHEIDPGTYDDVLKENVVVTRPFELPGAVRRGIEIALTPPYGPVRLGVPSGFLDREIEAPISATEPERSTYDNEGAYGRATELLAESRWPVVYAGGGTRRTAEGSRIVRALAETLDAPVLCSHKGKGVFPGDDPRFLGVTGSHTPAGVWRVLEQADCVLALGTDFDGVTTGHWELPMGESIVQIDLDPGAIGRSYDAEIGIVADATDAGDRLVAELNDFDLSSIEGWNGEAVASNVREEYFEQLNDQGLFNDGPPLPTPAVLRAVRDTIPRGTPVVTDVGGFRLWSMQAFDAYDPQAFVTAGSWAGMGTGLPGAIGAAFTNENQIVCLTGDGGLLMCTQELHTAAEHDLDVVVLVSVNDDYGIISKSMHTEYGPEARFRWDSPDFVAIAEGFGCRATHVETTSELREATEAALDQSGPDVISVAVDPDEPAAPEVGDYESAIDL
ncbi:thiamine pyrophosphate-binding protein [Halobacteriales archaeon QS_3_64_16]|nr:MAG: thiamine pyrophosphate-binding protein [Halobacteriales archaeon QS_3_64_16]